MFCGDCLVVNMYLLLSILFFQSRKNEITGGGMQIIPPGL